MNLIRHRDRNYAERLRALTASSSLFDAGIEERTRGILEEVYRLGDAALVELTERFGGPRLSPDQLVVGTAELMNAFLKTDDGLRAAVDLARRNIEAFSRRGRKRGWMGRNAQGGRVGEKFDPIQRVGIYIPGGTAPLVSTCLMTIVLAKVAGCPEIVVCTPCGRDGSINPALLFAARTAGATEIYRLGGAQAIAAMAVGTPTVRHVAKIFGPGNAYVVTAKRLLFGHVAVDLLPGPSEVLVLADDHANPRHIAADLLAQAEHGDGHERVWLVTPSGRLLREVNREIERQLPRLDRREFIARALADHGWLVHVASLDEGIDLVNRLAPEHCEIMTRRPSAVAARIITAGALFLGPHSPTVLGDYVAGPSHTLPTGGAGIAFAGLTVDQFQRRTSVVEYNRAALRRSLPAVDRFAAVEGLSAHGRSARIRFES